MKNFYRVIVQGIDMGDMEDMLLRDGYKRLSEYDVEYVMYGDGTCERRNSYKSVYAESLIGGKLRIYLGDPGELCARIEGPMLEVSLALASLGISFEQFEQMAKA